MAATAAGAGSSLPPELRTLLSSEMEFSVSDLADLQAGKVVAHGLGAPSAGEIAAVGAVRVHVRRATFVEQYRDIVRFKHGAGVVQIGPFSHPPRPEDLSPLTLTKEDVDLRTCRVGHCDIRLSAAIIGRFQREIDWTARDADARAASLFKHVLLDQVNAYVSGQPGQIVAYRRRDAAGPPCRRLRRPAPKLLLHRHARAGPARASAGLSFEFVAGRRGLPVPGRRRSLGWRRSLPSRR